MFTLKRNYFEEQSLAFIKQFDDMVQCIVALEILDVYRIVFDWDMRDRIEDDASPLGMRCKAKDYILHELMPHRNSIGMQHPILFMKHCQYGDVPEYKSEGS